MAAPVAAYSVTPLRGIYPLTVVFTDASTNTPDEWLWDFGDGTTSAIQNPSKTYTRPGLFTVTLTATNADGSDHEVKTGYVLVLPARSRTTQRQRLCRVKK